MTNTPDTETQVCEDIKNRQQLGINKYGTTVAQNPLELRQWLQHSYEEKLDDGFRAWVLHAFFIGAPR